MRDARRPRRALLERGARASLRVPPSRARWRRAAIVDGDAPGFVAVNKGLGAEPVPVLLLGQDKRL